MKQAGYSQCYERHGEKKVGVGNPCDGRRLFHGGLHPPWTG